MSCAHTFDTWCSECIDGLVQQYNALRVELVAVKAERDELRAVLELVADCDADGYHTCGFRVTAERALGRGDDGG